MPCLTKKYTRLNCQLLSSCTTSKEFITYWKKVANIQNQKWRKVKIEGRATKNRYLLLNKNDTTTFCITQHTTYFGTSDEELLESGIKIKEFHES